MTWRNLKAVGLGMLLVGVEKSTIPEEKKEPGLMGYARKRGRGEPAPRNKVRYEDPKKRGEPSPSEVEP